ncbi:sulfur carrier protein ThiS [Tenacibaculum finnmarkense genomovar finnmarkense]|uniref:sulfur carrier protein ThiS n=1 Tax=Tenacibaculum finnmarkense TaxID=2781243 RepID=UPI001E2CA5F4|nr:sulfur carrier protein ThiS [Tenacibaculum finnmarkense]MCD8417327.1 sulfur carrier protein ThiS [Tenacibaculum finnmarkense genomovar finnmarkense]MCD8454011.1 sulfur carrier protein ThiS [Tenacibaculum finnmarkense genomovar ulcerans]MCG8185778.1 sulfur carrier protein ThiS [Tenacibaculum finnmarkense genomovar finnmarkense]MCG8202331.1 sulfur carrier protein ThiS [Tenacibaculum finnmarkense genomovar finnmarkense]MCG8209665.1 sulfur carrier protein ThiS [Tenacibaculum finnmarkense genomo
MITIQVNQQEHQILETQTLQKFVENLKIQTNGIAIAINNSVVKKTDWAFRLLQDNDDILIIKSTQGG